MDQVSTRTWILIGMVGMLLFGGFWMRVGVKRSAWGPSSPTFSYEMPRPKNYEPPFQIGDRGVERHYKTLPQLNPPQATAYKAPVHVQGGKKPADPKAEAAKKAFLAKAASAQKAAAERKKKAEVNVVDTSRDQTMTDTAAAETQPQFDYSTQQARAAKKSAPAASSDQEESAKEEEEEEQLSAAQWRNLMQMTPSPQNVAKFVKAKQKGKVDAASYYQIVHELLIDTAEDRRKAGLAILDADASATTFSFMVTESEQAPTDVRPQLKARVDAYSEPMKFGLLVRVLGSNEPENVLAAATERLAKALTEFKQVAQNTNMNGPAQNGMGNNPALPAMNQMNANRRLAGAITAQHFAAFVSSLQKLSKHMNSSLASRANTLLTEIQALSGKPSTPASMMAATGSTS